MPPYRDPVTGKFTTRPADGEPFPHDEAMRMHARQAGRAVAAQVRAKIETETPRGVALPEQSMTEQFRRLVLRARVAPPTAAQRRAVATRRAANKAARKSRKVNR